MHRLLTRSCGIILPVVAGCAFAGRSGPSPADVAAAREWSQQGVAAVEAGHWDQAEALLRKSIETSPSDAVGRRYLAETLWRRGAFEEALQQMEAALQADETNPQLAVRAGEMLLAAQSNELAVARADQAIRLDPKLSAAWALRGRAFWRMTQIERALADLQRALDYAPQDRDVLLDIAGIYRQINQPSRCLTTLHQLIDTYPPGQAPQQALLLEGITLQQLGRGRQAAESLLAAARAGPPSADVYGPLAQAYASIGEVEAATAAAQQALAIDANHAPSRALLAQLAGRSAPDPEAPIRR
jgi:tetratricopeptide (TPR) repeat protein